jgi:trehalose 6-phosphate phosphatase
MVWELRPAVRGDKGDGVRRVVAESGARAVVVVGDDLGDLPAFAAVAELTAQGHDGLRVAVRSAEAPPDLLAAADLVLDGPEGVLDFLRRLAA